MEGGSRNVDGLPAALGRGLAGVSRPAPTGGGTREQVLRNWYPRFLANGCDFNDVERILQAAPRWEDWPDAWGAVAREYGTLAERGAPLTATRFGRLASLYAHFGQFMAFGSQAERDALHRSSVEYSRRALEAGRGRWRRFEIADGDGATYYANLRLPPAGVPPFACVVLLPGLDSTKEEWAAGEDLLLAYGLATFTLEGPGQGEARYRGGWRPEHEIAVRVALDALLAAGEAVDPRRLGIAGRSFGGYLSARAAACEPRLRACVVLGGTFDLEPWEQLQPIIRRDFQHFCAVPDQSEAAQVARRVTLSDVAEGLTAPLLVVHGGRDDIFAPAQARRVYDAGRGPKDWLFYRDGNHVCENYASRYRPLVAEWLVRTLGA